MISKKAAAVSPSPTLAIDSKFKEMKANGEKISMLTCYDYSTAKLMEAAGINAVLVGDSLGNTMLGYPDTLSVTMEEMLIYGRAVARGCSDTLVVLDMPFMSYQISIEQALMNAGRMMKEGRGGAVKLEGGALRRCPVRTNGAIPKGKIFEAMDEINAVTLTAPVKIGQVVIPDLLGTGIDLIVTRSIDK